MGGEHSGQFASRIAVEKITRLLPAAFRAGVQGISAGFEDILTELFHRIHARLTYFGQSYADCAGMGATLSLCWLTPDRLFFGHIGDSRLYYLPGEVDLIQVSHD